MENRIHDSKERQECRVAQLMVNNDPLSVQHDAMFCACRIPSHNSYA